MKNKIFLVLIAFICSLSGNIYAQVVDDDEQSANNFDSFYEKTIDRKAKKPFEYPYVREADIVWAQRVWRVVDFREKMNQPFYYPVVGDENGDQGRENLFTVLDKALKEGSIKCYKDDMFREEADYNKILADAGNSKTVPIMEVDMDGIEYERDSTVYTALRPDDVTSMRIKEDWYVDKQRSVRDVRIMGFALIYMKQRDDGEIAPFPLGWIRYNDPAVRNILANSEVYNPKNDVERRSYDDVFVKRMFTSYIIRTSNVYNRAISQYLTGMDALFESQNIEEDIFNLEQDMWEY